MANKKGLKAYNFPRFVPSTKKQNFVKMPINNFIE